jgi:hypothetical protein
MPKTDQHEEIRKNGQPLLACAEAATWRVTMVADRLPTFR